MEFLKVFTIVVLLLVLVSLYQLSNVITCKNYMLCMQDTTSGRVIILSIILMLAAINKYLAALVVIFLSIFLFDLNTSYGIFDRYNCEVIDKPVKIDDGITQRLEEKLVKKRNQNGTVNPRDGDIMSTPSSVIINECDDVPLLDIKTIGNVKFEYS